MRKIDFEGWLKKSGKTVERARFILDHFDVTQLKRRRKSPGRARRKPGSRAR